ncbi:SurA N-terminal domain-containing protein [Methyloterricola oryzae]|uniref:SurA N-terminal domain-containing protein n=1 Tax=Methyloterricola oryzae TaxID=1495050 RepID=UPI0005EB14A8|nr:SurA N-terminal domain-containing protein [Methyloterricola oryzae]
MLQAIRNRAQGIFAWIILVLICVPFALWGIQNYLDSGKELPVAVVGDRDIFERDVNRVYEQSLANLVGLGQYDEAELKREALNRVIKEEVITQNAQDKGLAVSDEDVRAFIQTLPYFQTDGKFDKEKYRLMLSSQGLSAAQFVMQIRKALLMEQLQRSVSDTGFTTQKDLSEFYRLRNQERSIEYLTLPVVKFEGEIPQQEIAAYYEQNPAEFQTPEKVSVQYLLLSLEQIASTMEPGEDEIKALYEEQKSQLTTPERRKVSHILITTDSEHPEDDPKALEKAQQIRQRLAKGEDFAKVAKEASQDKLSAEKGGDLGFINKDAMEPNFADAAFALGKGALSEPVKTSFGYHLIKVTELEPASTKRYEEVRDELAKNLKRSAAENKFYELGQTLTEQSFEHPDTLEPAAKALNLSIQETALFTRDLGTDAAAEKEVREAAFNSDVLSGKNSEPVEIGGEKVYVVRVKEHQPAAAKPLDSVKQEIVAKLRDKKAREAAKERTDKLLAGLKTDGTLADLAKGAGVSLNQPQPFQRNTDKLPLPLVAAAFKAPRPLQAGNARPERLVLENGDQVLFRVLAVKDGTTQSVDPKELEMATEYLQKNMGQEEYAAFVEQLRVGADVYIKPQQ